jgi:hypothetical protein
MYMENPICLCTVISKIIAQSQVLKAKTYEARAEFCQIFRSFLGQWSFKENSFCNLLTFNTLYFSGDLNLDRQLWLSSYWFSSSLPQKMAGESKPQLYFDFEIPKGMKSSYLLRPFWDLKFWRISLLKIKTGWVLWCSKVQICKQ